MSEPLTFKHIDEIMKRKLKQFDMGGISQSAPSTPPQVDKDQDLLNYLDQILKDLVKAPLSGTAIRTQLGGDPWGFNPFKSYWNQPPDEESRFERDWRSQMPRTWKGWSQSDIDKQTAKVWLDEGKGVLCARFPFKQKAIDEFREKIPKGKKAWNADDKLWEFSVETIDIVVDILTRNFDEVIDLTQVVSSPPIVVLGDPFLSLLDKDDLKAIYRILANKYHPDKGGDAGKMAKINMIFSQIK